MAAPTIIETTETDAGAAQNYTVNLPATVNASDWMGYWGAIDGSTISITPATDWTEVGESINNNSAITFADYVADGDEDGGTIDPSQGSGINKEAVFFVFRVASGDYSGRADGSFSSGNGADPPSHSPSGGSDTYLWMTAINTQTGVASGAPTNYGNLNTLETGTGTGDAHLSSAERDLLASSENPGAFSGTFGNQIARGTCALAEASVSLVVQDIIGSGIIPFER